MFIRAGAFIRNFMVIWIELVKLKLAIFMGYETE